MKKTTMFLGLLSVLCSSVASANTCPVSGQDLQIESINWFTHNAPGIDQRYGCNPDLSFQGPHPLVAPVCGESSRASTCTVNQYVQYRLITGISCAAAPNTFQWTAPQGSGLYEKSQVWQRVNLGAGWSAWVRVTGAQASMQCVCPAGGWGAVTCGWSN